jgi:aspartate carbamoyltransferase catalytic subunit
VENKTYGFCGDLKFGRTVHSLVKFLSNYEGVRFIFISPEELRVPEYIREEVVRKKGIPFEEVDQMEPYMNQLDFLYMTRVQRERFFNEEDYIRLKDRFILDKEKMSYARPDTYILHPLPRVNEISTEVDDDPRAQYFQQAKNGMYVRMALILKLLGIY